MLKSGEHNVLTLTMHLVSVHSCIIEALSCTIGLIMIFWKRSHICLFPEKHHNTHKNQPSLWSVSLWTMEGKNFKQKQQKQPTGSGPPHYVPTNLLSQSQEYKRHYCSCAFTPTRTEWLLPLTEFSFTCASMSHILKYYLFIIMQY